MIKTKIKRVATFTQSEIKNFKLNSMCDLDTIGNNWTNLNSLTKVSDKFSSDFDVRTENVNLSGEFEVEFIVKDIIVSLHNYHEDNIVYYNEQECHCNKNQLLKIIELHYENKKLFVELQAVNNLEFEIQENNYSLYEKTDRMYLELINFDSEEIDDYLE